MKDLVIFYFAIIAAEILVTIACIKWFLWWDGIWVVLGILCGLGMWAGVEIEARLKKKKK
jgi:hypothetical protein